MQRIGYQLIVSKAELARSGDTHPSLCADGFFAKLSAQHLLLGEGYAELGGYLGDPVPAVSKPEPFQPYHAAALEIALLRSVKPNFQLAATSAKMAGALLFFPEECLVIRDSRDGSITLPVEKDTPGTISMVQEYLGYSLAACMRLNTFIETVREQNPALSSPVMSFEENYDLANWLPQAVVRHMSCVRDLGFLLRGGSSAPDLLREWMRTTLPQNSAYHERFYLVENKVFLGKHLQAHAFAAIDACEANTRVVNALNAALANPHSRADAIRSPLLMNVVPAMKLVA